MSDDITRVTRSQGPSPEQWEDLRPIIERCYKTQNQTADEVRRLLQQQYGFTVTTKMFKQHIRKWRLDKKFKQKEMIFSFRKIQQRKKSGKATRIAIRGEVLTEVRLNYYFKRRPMTVQENLEPDPPTPTDLYYSTPKDHEIDEETLTSPQRVDEAPSSSSITEMCVSPKYPAHLVDSSELAHNSRSLSPNCKEAMIVTQLSTTSLPLFTPLTYSLSPQEAFLRQLYEHVRLSTAATNEVALFPKRPKFDTRSILRASGWYDSFLNDAIEADKKGHRDVSTSIVSKCANIVAAEVDGYFPHLCLLEMVEIVHYLQSRSFGALQLQFMYALYDNVAHHLGQFHPLVELITCATRGYTCSLSPTLIPTMLDFLDKHNTNEVSLNTLLPLFAFQELRAIDSIPRDLLMAVHSSKKQVCDGCLSAIDESPFTSNVFRGWIHRQFINLLNDVWVEPDAESTAAFHAITRSRVWRYLFKHSRMAERRIQLQKMRFKERFWAVSRICFELVSKLVQRVFLEFDEHLTRFENISKTINHNVKRIALVEDDLKTLWEESWETGLLESEPCSTSCEHEKCQAGKAASLYWTGCETCRMAACK